ncbi:UDPglucose 6-dehydrogenase [Rhodopseudomonas julia]|uniref:UDP-glucose 6-dehydrogenase n=1 Tax=Rhodopseudomonas julia TaxID=200617 RepID=A0ABU0CA32_9BRAD|nr:UDP-glucose/GDP-mannose dehydrogenase family protein [Rhodopseudomonas julia]MDQ0326751.1 UDPglucose 6-dehydrogenase [Rhodopseudomonas julia]
MRITMIGTGYVGLVSGVCFSEFGFDVTCVDKDQAKIAALQRGEVPIYEPGLAELMVKNADRLTFTTDLPGAVENADVIFIAVGTPTRRGDGEADLSYVYAAAREVGEAMRSGSVVVIKSTVVVGTCREVRRIIEETAPNKEFSVASNPEFLREGAAIEDFLRPDRVVVGVEDERGEQVLKALYRPLNLRQTPIVFTSLENAEITKYAANAFLAMKISFINEIADLCETVGGNVQDIARGIGLDNRIGPKFLHPGPGYGGSCFPKDTRALAATARRLGSPIRLVETTIAVNEERMRSIPDRVIAAHGGSVEGKTIAVLGIAFKPNTDDIREAPSLTAIPALQAAGATIRAHDPQAAEAAKPLLPDVTWCNSPYAAAEGADGLVIMTEWNEYRALNLATLSRTMRGNVLIDLRNIYPPEEVAPHAFNYHSVGRKPHTAEPKSPARPRLVSS